MNKPFVLLAEERPKLRKKVLSLLRHGKSNAIRGKELARLCNYKDDRLIRVVLDELIEEGVPVASSVSEPFGYFIVSNPDEAADYIRVLKGRKREIDLRLSHFEQACVHMTVPKQSELL